MKTAYTNIFISKRNNVKIEIVISDYDRHRKTSPQPQSTGKVQARGCGGRVPHFAGEGAEENRPE